MSMNVMNNASTLNAHRQSLVNQQLLQASMRQISSGQRINSAADDPAGLGVSERMRAQQTALERAMMNAQDGVSLSQTADGALGSMNSMLNRLSELATQASNGILGDTERKIIDNEAQSLLGEINRISQATNFNGIPLLDGSLSSEQQITVSGASATKAGDSLLLGRSGFDVFDGSNAADATFSVNGKSFMLADAANYSDAMAQYGGSDVQVIQTNGSNAASLTSDDMETIAAAVNAETGLGFEAVAGGIAMEVGKGLQLQVGATSDDFNTITVSVGNMSSQGLGLSGLSLANQKSATSALDMVNEARQRVSSARGDLGATQNRLESTISSLSTANLNTIEAESRIRDTDIAKAMMELTKRSLLGQVSNAMQAQSNMQQSQVLQLLR